METHLVFNQMKLQLCLKNENQDFYILSSRMYVTTRCFLYLQQSWEARAQQHMTVTM